MDRRAGSRRVISTATTRPAAPTMRATPRVKNPIPHPGSTTIIPSRTDGPSRRTGSSRSLQNGTSNLYPSHQRSMPKPPERES